MHGHGGIQLRSTSQLEFLTLSSEFLSFNRFKMNVWLHIYVLFWVWWSTIHLYLDVWCFFLLLQTVLTFEKPTNHSTFHSLLCQRHISLSHTQSKFTASAGGAGRWSGLEPGCRKDSRTRIHFPRLGKIYFPLMKQHVIWQIHCGKSVNVNTTWTQIFHLELVLSQ